MKKIITVIFAAALAVSATLVVSCGKLDVVGTDSVRAFGELLEALPAPAAFDDANGGWSIAAPDGAARFVYSPDFSASPLHDVMLVLDAAPFIAAGLDAEKLPPDIAFFDGTLMLGTKLGTEKSTIQDASSPLAAYEQIVKLKRKSIGYHGALDHYGVSLGGGNMFEWAKNMGTNDKDIVFVLDPAPFIAAGVKPAGIEGWVFAKVTVDDENGKPVEVDKILKPFDLR
jgi:hypothetical protein